MGKLARVTALLDSTSFTTLAGLIDFLLPSVVVGSAGAISPLPNIAPVCQLQSTNPGEEYELTLDLEILHEAVEINPKSGNKSRFQERTACSRSSFFRRVCVIKEQCKFHCKTALMIHHDLTFDRLPD